MRTACRTALACLLLATASAAGFMAQAAAGQNSADMSSSCYGLGSADDRLRTAFAKGSTFPDQVYNAFAGQGSGDATGDYLTRGQDLFQLVDTVAAQCRATSRPAPIRRNRRPRPSAGACRAPSTPPIFTWICRGRSLKIDADQNPPTLPCARSSSTAMYKIADGGNYEAASAADAPRRPRSRIRR